jgi:ASPIC and UnbV
MGTFATLPGILTSRVHVDDYLTAFAQNEVSRIYLNDGGHFRDVSDQAKEPTPWDGRAVAMIDTANDGVLDLIATSRNGPVHFLKNQTTPSKRWIGFTLAPTRSAPGAPGARIEVRQGPRRFYRWSTAGKSGFLAYSDPRIHVGLPSGAPVDVTILWPSGRKSELSGLATGRYVVVREP